MATDGLRAGQAYIDLVPRMAPGFNRDVERGLNTIDGKAAGQSVGGKFAGAFRGLVGPAIAVLGAKVGVDFFKGAVDSASELNETVSKARTIFGAGFGELESWANKAAGAIGQSKQQALDASATFGNLFTQLGIGTSEAGKMSRSMVELASDFASFHNADISEVLNAQQAAFRGEFDAVQRFVPTINAAAVEQKALAMTTKSSAKELTAQEKALATQALLMEGAGAAAGDFARTSDGLANKQRILSARFEDIKARIGQALIPVVTRLVTVLADNLGPAMDALGRFFGPIFEKVGRVVDAFKILGGDDGVQGFAEIMDNVFGNSGKYVEFFRQLGEWILKVADFIGNNLKPILIGLGAGLALLISPIGAVVAALVLAYTKSEEFRAVVQTVIAWLVDYVVPAVAMVAGYIAEQFGQLVAWVQEHWAAISEAVGHAVEFIRTVIETAVAAIMLVWSYFGDTILAVITAAWENIAAVVEFGVDFIRGIIELALALINGEWGAAWDAITGILGAAWDLIKTVVGDAIGIVKSLIGDGLSAAAAIVSSVIDEIVGFFAALPGRLVSAAGDLFGFIVQGFKDAINSVIRLWNGIKFPSVTIGGQDPLGAFGPSLPEATIGGWELPNIPLLALGGHSRTGGLSIVGDAGPELLDLSPGASVVPLRVGEMIAGAALAARGEGGPAVAIENATFEDGVDLDLLMAKASFATTAGRF